MRAIGVVAALAVLLATGTALGQEGAPTGRAAQDTLSLERNSWGLDIMASNGGFGAGLFFPPRTLPQSFLVHDPLHLRSKG